MVEGFLAVNSGDGHPKSLWPPFVQPFPGLEPHIDRAEKLSWMPSLLRPKSVSLTWPQAEDFTGWRETFLLMEKTSG